MKKLSFLIISILIVPISWAKKVSIDVGHFNEKPGAISALGETELMYNQMMALNLHEAISYAGIQAKVNGLDGNLKSLTESSRLANGSDLLLSIHHDSVQEYDLREWEVSKDIQLKQMVLACL